MMATKSRTATLAALALLLLAAGCRSGIDLAGDGDRDVVPPEDADGAVDVDEVVEAGADADADDCVPPCRPDYVCYYGVCVPGGPDVDADADVDVEVDDGEEADADTCAGGWLDLSSGLCWQEPPLGGMTWEAAVARCEELSVGGHPPGTWHLPTVSELRSMIRGCPETMTGGSCGVTDSCLDGECRRSGICNCAFLAGPGAGGCYWDPALADRCAYPYWSSSALGPDGGSWTVDFNFGSVDAYGWPSGRTVRCVRPGP